MFWSRQSPSRASIEPAPPDASAGPGMAELIDPPNLLAGLEVRKTCSNCNVTQNRLELASQPALRTSASLLAPGGPQAVASHPQDDDVVLKDLVDSAEAAGAGPTGLEDDDEGGDGDGGERARLAERRARLEALNAQLEEQDAEAEGPESGGDEAEGAEGGEGEGDGEVSAAAAGLLPLPPERVGERRYHLRYPLQKKRKKKKKKKRPAEDGEDASDYEEEELKKARPVPWCWRCGCDGVCCTRYYRAASCVGAGDREKQGAFSLPRPFAQRVSMAGRPPAHPIVRRRRKRRRARRSVRTGRARRGRVAASVVAGARRRKSPKGRTAPWPATTRRGWRRRRTGISSRRTKKT